MASFFLSFSMYIFYHFLFSFFCLVALVTKNRKGNRRQSRAKKLVRCVCVAVVRLPKCLYFLCSFKKFAGVALSSSHSNSPWFLEGREEYYYCRYYYGYCSLTFLFSLSLFVPYFKTTGVRGALHFMRIKKCRNAEQKTGFLFLFLCLIKV